MPLAVRLFLAFVIIVLAFGAGVVASVFFRRWTLSREALHKGGSNALERSIADVVHKAYDHRDADNEEGNIGLTDQLSKLAKLHADGALSDDEVEALRARVVGEKREQFPFDISPRHPLSDLRSTWTSTVSRAIVIIFYTSVPLILLGVLFLLFTPSVGLFHNFGSPSCKDKDVTDTVINLEKKSLSQSTVSADDPLGIMGKAIYSSANISLHDVVTEGSNGNRVLCSVGVKVSFSSNPNEPLGSAMGQFANLFASGGIDVREKYAIVPQPDGKSWIELLP